MCGRFQLEFSLDELDRYYSLTNSFKEDMEDIKEAPSHTLSHEEILDIQGVIYPSNRSLVVKNNSLTLLPWGFPFNSKLIINARSETLYQKNIYSKAAKEGRCLVPVSLFYEWKDKKKYEISLPQEKLFSLAAIYKVFPKTQGGYEDRYVLITTEANKDMSKVHNRMPVIVPRELERDYLDPKASEEDIRSMLKPYNNILNITAADPQKPEQLSLF